MERRGPVYDAVKRASLDAPGSRKAIADFLLLEGGGVALLTMAQVASATYTSKPTLVRFAKHLGFSGWPEFREAFLTEAAASDARGVGANEVDVNYPFSAGDSLTNAVASVMSLHELASSHMMERLEEDELLHAAKLIDEAPHVCFFARPPSWYLGYHFAFNLNTIGTSCWIPHAEEGDLAINVMGSRDCALFVSYGGALVKEPFCYVEDVKERGATVIAITSDNSALAQAADIALTFEPLERYYDKITGFYSCASIQRRLEALFVACYLTHYGGYRENAVQRAERLARATGVSDDLAQPLTAQLST